MKEEVIAALKTVEDPELNLDIWTLGLVYDVEIADEVTITMTLTTPTCPYGPQIINEASEKVGRLGKKVKINLTFTPPWQPSEELREMLGV